jgi:ParB-like chromosome segregation protein Spo0J
MNPSDQTGPDESTDAAPAHQFLRTESLCGRASESKVRDLIASMRRDGWIGKPIDVIVINSEMYILNGHHRVYAARVVGILVHFRVIAPANLINYAYDSTDQVIDAHAEAGPNRIRVRR